MKTVNTSLIAAQALAPKGSVAIASNKSFFFFGFFAA